MEQQVRKGTNLCAEQGSPPSASRERGLLLGLYLPDLIRGPFWLGKLRVLIAWWIAQLLEGRFVFRNGGHAEQGGHK